MLKGACSHKCDMPSYLSQAIHPFTLPMLEPLLEHKAPSLLVAVRKFDAKAFMPKRVNAEISRPWRCDLAVGFVGFVDPNYSFWVHHVRINPHDEFICDLILGE